MEKIAVFCQYCALSPLTRSDLGVTTIIGAENYNDGGIYGTLDAYADVPSLIVRISA